MKPNARVPDIKELFSSDQPPRREHHYTRWSRLLLIGAVIFLLLFAGTSAAILWRVQQQAEQRAVVTVRGEVETASHWLSDQLALVEALDPHWLLAAKADAHNSPWSLIEASKAWHALRVIDADGATLAQFGPSADLPARLAPPTGHSTLAVLPSLPLAGRSTWVTPILFPAASDGLRVVGLLSQAAVERLVRRLRPQGDGSLSVVSSDARVLLRYPTPGKLIGQDVSRAAFFATPPVAGEQRNYWIAEEIDGHQWLTAYRRLEGYPLVVTAGLNAAPILNRARNEIISAASILLVVFLFIATVANLLIRQLRHNENVTKSLQKAEARLRELATHDGLTECLNRRAILVEASSELHRYRRTRRPFSLLMLDIDNFSQLNDRFGHLVGDSILVGMAALCRDLLRPTDQIGRYGGEEFLILLPETDTHTATRVANRLRDTVAGMAFETGKEQVSITLSIGVAVANPTMQSLKPLIQCAETALHTAKTGGRNRVCVEIEAQPQTG